MISPCQHMPFLFLLLFIFTYQCLCQQTSQLDQSTYCSIDGVHGRDGTLQQSQDGNQDFEIVLYTTRFLQDESITIVLKQLRENHGISEFVLKGLDHNNEIVGRFDQPRISDRNIKYFSCSSGNGNTAYTDKLVPPMQKHYLAWRAEVSREVDQIIFRADVVSGNQLYHVQSKPLKRRVAGIPDGRELSVEQCGEIYGCLIVPQHCTDSKCEYLMQWQGEEDDKVKFRIQARADSFAGVGFSTDKHRGDDQVVLCIKDPNTNYARVQNMFLSVQTPQLIEKDYSVYGLEDPDAYANETHINCEFTRSMAPYGYIAPSQTADQQQRDKDKDNREKDTRLRSKIVDLREPHYVYPIYGDQQNLQQLPPGPALTIVNDHAVNFYRRLRSKSHVRGSWLAKVHATLMMIAWILLASTGILIARYYKPIWPRLNYKSEKQSGPWWLWFHEPLMITTAVLSVIALLFILFELRWKWTSGTHHLWHSILGMIVIGLSFLNPILGVLRPDPNSRARCCWYWMHWLIGSLAHCIAIPVIFLGMDNRRLDLWNWCSWLLLAWCIFHMIVEIILEIHYCCTIKKNYERMDELEYHPDKQDPRKPTKAPGYRWKPGLLIFYILITAAVVIALIIAVILYDGY
ncbi:unnamed protein product [Didymodactylos carnosus]|nr:unnamed protein product [Didymodactylos carnosus]CAF3566812.1 unnamed protein product [Didymodactylos carnosus]